MNDFERKLSQQPFRAAPPDLRAAIIGVPTHELAPVCWSWRDWFWPSPQAWGALAAVWVVFFAISFRDAPPETASRPFAARPPADLTLLTAHTLRDFPHVLDSSN